MKPWMLAGVVALALSSAAMAQDAERPRVTVVGEGSAEQAPDFEAVVFAVRGEAPTATDALAALKANQARMDSSLAALKGVGSMQVNTGSLNTTETYRNPACRANPSLASGDCAVTGVIVNIAYAVRVYPAERAGDVASLATQLGAIGVRTAETGLKDTQKLADAAAAQAFNRAKAQAQQAADAAGMALGPIISIQPGVRVVLPLGLAAPAPPPPLPIPPVSLATSLTLKPPPVRQNASVTVTFALQPKR